MELFFRQFSFAPEIEVRDREIERLEDSLSLSELRIYHFFETTSSVQNFLHTHIHTRTNTRIISFLSNTRANAITHSHSLSLSLSLPLSSQDYFTTFFSEPFCSSAFIGPSYSRRFLKRPTILLPRNLLPSLSPIS